MLRTFEEEEEVEPPYCYQSVYADSCDSREMLGVVRGGDGGRRDGGTSTLNNSIKDRGQRRRQR